jgi:hypothetical protein
LGGPIGVLIAAAIAIPIINNKIAEVEVAVYDFKVELDATVAKIGQYGAELLDKQ